MTEKITANIPIGRLVDKQVTQWETIRQMKDRGQALAPEEYWQKAFFTISRAHGSGGDKIAQIIGERLNWQVCNRELVEQIAAQTRVPKSIIESFDEKRRNEIQVWLQTIFDSQALSTDNYIRHLISALMTLAEQGQVIIVGRGANFVLKSPFALRIRITAPLDCRIRLVMAEEEISYSKAQNRIKEVDHQRLAFIRHYYHADTDKPCAYDFIINTEDKPLEWVAELLIATLKSKIENFQRLTLA